MSYRRVPSHPNHAADEAQGEGGREGEASGLDVGHYPGGGGGDHAVDVEEELVMLMIKLQATPIWRLLIDPHIACCAGNNNISISANSSCP